MKSTNPQQLIHSESPSYLSLLEVEVTATIARFPTAEDCKYIGNDLEESLSYLNTNSKYFDGKHKLYLHWQGKYEDEPVSGTSKFIPLQLCVGLPDGIGLPVEWFNVEGDI